MLPLSKTSQEPAMVGESTGCWRLLNMPVIEMEARRMRLGIEVDSEVSMHDAEVWERIRAAAGETC
jgi:sRNA-binding carbon storage regulator CsrA